MTGMFDGLGERDRRLEIETAEQSVAGNVGVDEGGDAGVLELAGDVQHGELGALGPALDRQLAVAGIECDRDAIGKFARRIVGPGRDRGPPRCR